MNRDILIDARKIGRPRKADHLNNKSSLCELLSPDEIDYEQLKRKEGSKGSVCVENEADASKSQRNCH